MCVMVCVQDKGESSTCGFQSLSYRMTVSAVAKFNPNPPALVEMRKMNRLLLGALNRRTSKRRCTRLVSPSSRT